jgi:hypothetical protein
MNKWTLALGLTAALALGGVALAQEGRTPVENVGRHHLNLEKAQELGKEAYAAISASQNANEFDEGGHGQKAKELLEQANQEMSLAAQYLNEHGHK